MLAFCFSSNNFSDDLEVVEDLDDLDDLDFLKSVSYRVSNSLHSSRKFSTVLVISIT